MRWYRWLVAVSGLAIALTACTSPTREAPDSLRGASAVSALRDGADHPDLPAPQVDVGRIIAGGPPPDGIPPIHEPTFSPVPQVDWLKDSEPVIVLRHKGQTKLYPVQVLTWHEIVNDEIAGDPVTVTYCPLCNTAIAFNPVVDDQVLTFGTSGSLYKSALVMYDTQTESLWSQVERRAIAGQLSGTEMGTLPLSMLPWQTAREQLPEAAVLERPRDSDRPYGTNPYVGYDTDEWTLLDQPTDDRLPAKERVVHLLDHGVAVRATELVERQVANVTADEQPMVLFAADGLASALDDRAIAEGRPIPATGVFSRRVNDRTLTFTTVEGDGRVVARDADTGSKWTLLGEAVAGPLQGEQLTQVTAVDTFWFAAKAFQPELTLTDITDPLDASQLE